MPTPKSSSGNVAIHAEVTSVHVCALVAVQLAYGGYHVVSKVALQEGVNRYVFCAYRDIIAVVALFAFQFVSRCICGIKGEGGDKGVARSGSGRTGGPSSSGGGEPVVVGPTPWRALSVLAFTGIFVNQLLFLKGLSLTSPVVAGALQPCIPVFTFLLAVTLGTAKLSQWTTADTPWNGGRTKGQTKGYLMTIHKSTAVLLTAATVSYTHLTLPTIYSV